MNTISLVRRKVEVFTSDVSTTLSCSQKRGNECRLRKVQGKAKTVCQINLTPLRLVRTPRRRSNLVALKYRQFFRSSLNCLMRSNVTMTSSKASFLDFLSMVTRRNWLAFLVEQVLYKIKHLNYVLCMRRLILVELETRSALTSGQCHLPLGSRIKMWGLIILWRWTILCPPIYV